MHEKYPISEENNTGWRQLHIQEFPLNLHFKYEVKVEIVNFYDKLQDLTFKYFEPKITNILDRKIELDLKVEEHTFFDLFHSYDSNLKSNYEVPQNYDFSKKYK